MDQAHEPLVVPIKAHIAADAAVIHHPETGHQRHTAAQYQLVPAPLPQKGHSTGHAGRPGFPFTPKRRCGIEEVQLHKVKAPLFQNPMEHILQICLYLLVVDIQGVKPAPVAAAVPGLPVDPQKPIRVFPIDGRPGLADEWRKPKARPKPIPMAFLRKAPQALRKLGGIRFQPVPHRRFPAIVDLEEAALGQHLPVPLQILTDRSIADVLVTVIPAGIAGQPGGLPGPAAHGGEPGVKHLPFPALGKEQIKGVKPAAVVPDPGTVPADGQLFRGTVIGKNGVARRLIQRTDKAVGIALAEIAIGKAMALAFFSAVRHEMIIPIPVQAEVLPNGAGHLIHAPHTIPLSHFRTMGPGLIAIHE